MNDTTPGPSGTVDRIGPYRLLKLLGEGGMGEVWLAEQSEPVHRRVALKIIKLGMDTRQVVARFEAERQALAVMDHPGIAQVFDGGATEDGRPYFVMELVQGIPITEYCDTQRLSTEERTKLFMALCHAVQHAHHKGVIHRDIKPSNVLVTVKEGEAVVKVIDFGIAKALGHDLTERTLVTRMGQIVGTPEYMSPEQAEMSGLDVDTRTDVYALGVMLYELLVGALPYDFSAKADEAIRHAIRETEVPRPSTKLTSLGGTRETIARYRRTTVEALRRELRSDLDWIILRAMEKDRTRRYDTANGLALDLERHLRHEPVLARAPSARYRVGKFIRRHRLGVAAGAAIAVALILGTTLATAGMVRARRAERRAEAEAEAARQVTDFLVDIFGVSDPEEARGNTITAREILDQGADRILTDLAEQPPMQARLMATMGQVYENLGLYPEAGRLLAQATVIQREELGDRHPELASSLRGLARVRVEQGRFEEAESLFVEAVAIRDEVLGPDDPATGRVLTDLANLYRELARFEEAEPLLRRTVELKESQLGPDHPDVATSLSSLATLLRQQGKSDEAEPLFVKALAIREAALGADHPAVDRTLNSLAILLLDQEKWDEAEQYLQRALENKERTLGPDHPDVANSANNLAILYARKGDLAGAERYFTRALEIREATLGSDHPSVGQSLHNLATLASDRGEYEKAEGLYLRSLAIRKSTLGRDHPDVAGVLNNLGYLYSSQGRFAEAEGPLERALAIYEEVYPPDHPEIARVLENLADVYRNTGRSELADSVAARAEAIAEARGGG